MAALVGALALVAFIAASVPQEDGVRRAPSPLGVSTRSDAFRAGFGPLLERAATNAAELVTIGETKERNLLRIHAAQEAMNASLADADAWLGDHVPPSPDQPAVAAYRRGADTIRQAMDEAQAGFLHFDFARVALATESMRQGAADLDAARVVLTGPAEPLATPHASIGE